MDSVTLPHHSLDFPTTDGQGDTDSEDEYRPSTKPDDDYSFSSSDDNGGQVEYPDDPDDGFLSVSSDHSMAGASDDIEPSNTFQTSTEFPESVNDVVLLDLAQRMRAMGAPLYGFDSILQWANDSQVRGFNFQFSTVPRYAPFIRSVKKRLHLDDLRYSMRTVNLPWGGSESFPVFDFIGMVHSLLDDPRVRPHLLIDWDCPSRRPPFEPGILDEIHSGSWDEDTRRLMIKENSNEVLAGVTAFIDGTHLTNKGRLNAECPLVSFSIIPRSIRNQPYGWRPLGFIPKFDDSHGPGQNLQAYHLVLDEIFGGLRTVQEDGGLTTKVLGPNGQEVSLKLVMPVCFVSGDIEGHHKLCGRFGSHNVSTLSHACDCPKGRASDHNYKCGYTKASTIKALYDAGEVETLREMSYHAIDNAFYKLLFGANIHGINGACPGEVLHMIQLGWEKYGLAEFYGKVIKGKTSDFLDKLCQAVSENMTRQSDRDFPRTNFPKPFSTILQLNANEYSGVLLVLVVSMHSRICWDNKRPDRKSSTKHSFANSDSIDRRRVKKFRDLFEMMLCFEAWYKLDKVPKSAIDSGASEKMTRAAIRQFVETVDRQEGNGMDLPKTHAPLHSDRFKLMFGSEQNANTGPGESSHKDFLKKPAKLTQRRKAGLEKQLAERQIENLVISHASALCYIADNSSQSSPIIGTGHVPGGTRFHVTFKHDESPTGDFILYRTEKWASRKKEDNPRFFPPGTTLDYLGNLLLKAVGRSHSIDHPIELTGYTEHKFDGHILRAHPDYRKGGPWNDWVNYQYQHDDSEDGVQVIPARIWYFLDLTQAIPFESHNQHNQLETIDLRLKINGYVSPGTYAVVTSLYGPPEDVDGSNILLKGKKYNQFMLIPTGSFSEPVMVVDNIGASPDSVFVVRPRSEWASQIIDLE
jgi:hypothetical protein